LSTKPRHSRSRTSIRCTRTPGCRKVGAFFTGPGDPRPTLRRPEAGLRALAGPVRRLLAARVVDLALRDRHDAAALRDDAPAFVRTVRASPGVFRRVAIAATVLGAPRCVL
jgi:hypothetical protein